METFEEIDAAVTENGLYLTLVFRGNVQEAIASLMKYFHFRKQGNTLFCCFYWVNLLNKWDKCCVAGYY